MAGSNLPKYNSAIADMLNWPPTIKMDFPRVGMRFYPLRADLARLQKVCDIYLNFIGQPDDRPPVYFRPAAPFVLLQTVNYDKLEIEKIGWLIQHEAIFSIPIEWYERQGGQWVFKDWAMTYPFIYLDHPISIWTGREMYGWPKVPVRVPRLFSLRNPPDPQGQVEFHLATHSRNLVHRPQPFRPFIEIRQEDGGISPWSVEQLCELAPRAIAGGLAAASTVVEAVTDFLLRKRANDQANPYPAMLQRGSYYLGKWIPEFLAMMMPGAIRNREQFTASPFMKNNIVLKQFRDAHEINSICYQALVKSEISVNNLIDAGLLFNPLSADTTGGVTVRLHHFATQPIVETLGLEVSEITDDHGVSVASLKPFFPFWWNLDLSYGNANVICWRSRTTKFALPGEVGAVAHRKDDYVKLGSGAVEAIAGAEKFPNFLMRVLPLKADPKVLAKLCDDLFDDVPYSIEPIGSYVFLIADQFREMTSADDPHDGWADSELRFVLLANCRDQRTGAVRLVILPLINFAGSEWNAISHREVNGRFALASDFVAPPLHGMEDLPPAPARPLRRLFSLRTQICPTLDEDEQTRLWTLIEVAEDMSGGAPKVSHSTSEELRPELDQWLQHLRLDAITTDRRLTGVSLKQFRDAQSANHACYQALVEVDRNFTNDIEIQPIREQLKVTIYAFDAMQIVQKFGLLGGTPHLDRRGRSCVVFEPEKPFWVRGDMAQELGVNLCWRAGGMPWQY
jgi:hypothetical protein